MATAITERDYIHKYKFRVVFGSVFGINEAAFQSCSAIEHESGDVEHRAGGSLIPYKAPGLSSFPDVTLVNGVTETDEQAYQAMLAVANNTLGANAAAGSGGVGVGNSPITAIKGSVTVIPMDRSNGSLFGWKLHNAYIKKLTVGDWDNTSEEVVLQTIVLRYDFFERLLKSAVSS